MSRWVGFAVAAVAAVACARADVQTERADLAVGPAPTVAAAPDIDLESPDPAPPTTPSDTTPPGTQPPSTQPPSTQPTPTQPTEPDDPQPADTAVDPSEDDGDVSTSAGDELFPALGSSDVDVVSYVVALDIDPSSNEVAAEVDVVANVAADVDVFPLDQIGLDVAAVTIDGAVADFDTTDTELLIELPPDRPDSVTASIAYSFEPDGAVSSAGLPAGWFLDEETDGSYVLNEPDGARTWLPSNDHPSDKATWRFELTVPTGTTAVANGALLSEPTADTADPWVWSQSEPMPTYLVQVIVGDYDIVEADPVTSIDGREIPITHVVPSGEADAFDEALESVGPQIAFFEERFGPYPLDRYGLAFVQDLSGLAMETQGRSMLGADDFGAGSLGFSQQLLLSHEVAHQWFGNAVSPADWSDIWLNEAFATYLQWLWLDDAGLQPLEAYADEMLDRRQVDGESTGGPSLDDMFEFLRYDGGAPIVHALRGEMGDDVFFELLTAWVAENNGTSRSTEAFIEMAERFHGDDLTDFFDAWLFAGDLPDEYP